MTTIRLRFPASRYHATPWGRHVNEGVTEWPPSPYRLLRALYDVWQRKCAKLSAAQVERILQALSSELPSFSLPQATASHTRSYLSANGLDAAEKNLVFDGFLAFRHGAACYLSWPTVAFEPEEQRALNELLLNLNYLGRSESWIEADLCSGDASYQCAPVGTLDLRGEAVPVAVALAPSSYSGKKKWIEALTYSTTEVMKQKLSGPPLLKHVRYALPSGAVDSDPVPEALRKRTPVQAVLIRLDGIVLPLATETIAVAEQIRTRLMGAHRKAMGGDKSKVSSLFSGKTPEGERRLDHGHIYILPQSNRDGRIHSVLLLSRLEPFNEKELDAVRGVRELYQSDGRPGVRCVVTWQGSLNDRAVRDPANEVRSVTPFVTARHLKKKQDPAEFYEAEIRRECRNQNYPEPLEVDRIDDKLGLFVAVEYRRNRPDDPARPGLAFRLKFAEPIITPFSLGYGSHFGLGQFVPIPDAQKNSSFASIKPIT